MSEIYRHTNTEAKEIVRAVEDPRHQDLHVPLTKEEADLLRAGQLNELAMVRQREGKDRLAAQIYENIRIYTNEEERTQIHVPIVDPSRARFLQQNADRAQWESWKDKDHPLYARYAQAAVALSQAQLERRTVRGDYTLPTARLALGMIYVFSEPDPNRDGQAKRKMAIRVNNDWGRNIYAGWGNPMSGLTGPMRPMHPMRFLRQQIDEIVPAAHDEKGQLRPYFPENFFDKSRTGDWQSYKKHALKVEQGTTEVDITQRFEGLSVPYQLLRPETGIDLAFDFQFEGGRQRQKPHILKNVNALITAEGTIEAQLMVEIPRPEALYDREFGSHIIVADVDMVAQWWYDLVKRPAGQRVRHQFAFDQVIDGETGQPLRDEAAVTVGAGKNKTVISGAEQKRRYLEEFQASPPLALIFEELYWQKELGQ